MRNYTGTTNPTPPTDQLDREAELRALQARISNQETEWGGVPLTEQLAAWHLANPSQAT